LGSSGAFLFSSFPLFSLNSTFSLQPDDTARALGDRLESAWQKRRDAIADKQHIHPPSSQQAAYSVVPADGRKKGEKDEKTKRPNLAAALAAAYGGPFMWAALFKLLQDILSFSQPQLLKRLLQFVATYNTDTAEPAFHGCASSSLPFLSFQIAHFFLTRNRPPRLRHVRLRHLSDSPSPLLFC
jgi:hypothetical protein